MIEKFLRDGRLKKAQSLLDAMGDLYLPGNGINESQRVAIVDCAATY